MSEHDHHSHGEHGASSDMDMDISMPMYFMNTWHTTLWFKSWETQNVSQYVLSLLGLVLMGVMHEAIACYRAYYLSGSSWESGGMLQEPLVGVASPRVQKPRSGFQEKLVASALYAGNICTGYLLMLAVMTFNVGYFFAVIAGMGIGYFLLFDLTHKSALARGEACHPRPDTSRA